MPTLTINTQGLADLVEAQQWAVILIFFRRLLKNYLTLRVYFLGAQAFNAQGPLGGFGASAANTGSQGFHAGPGGISGSAGQSGSQTYNLPGGHSANLAYGQGFSHANGNPSYSNTNSLSFT